MLFVRHVIELLVNPFFISLLLLMAAIILIRRASAAMVRTILLAALTILLLVSTGWLPRYATAFLESRYPVVTQVDKQIKWVVVLNGGRHEVAGMPANQLLTSASLKRVVEGLRLFRALPDARLVLSGGAPVSQEPEALLLAELTQWFAIPADKLVLETRSLNTADQARELKAIVHQEPFYLVTSAVHMPRAMALCEQQGLHPVAAPVDFTFYWSTETGLKMLLPSTYNLAYFSIALHEILGRVWMRLA